MKKIGYLIKRQEAITQRKAEEDAKIEAEQEGNTQGDKSGSVSPFPDLHEETDSYDPDAKTADPKPEAPKFTRFFLNATLDNTRINPDVSKIMEEVLNHIAQDGTLESRLETQAASPNGFKQQTVRTASENCRTLKINNFGFEEE